MARDHVVIIGCGFGGIATAGLLAQRFAQVTIVERDDVPDDGRPRKGVPQSPHVHGILKLGRDILDETFPGFVSEVEAEGSPLFDWLTKGIAFTGNGWAVRGPSSIRGFGIRRAVLEHLARRRVLSLGNVELVKGSVDGLETANSRVTGVALSHAEDARESIRSADLVVDTSGRTASSSKWLEDAGYKPPEETVVNAFGGYASRHVHIPEERWPGDWRYVAQMPLPRNPKGAVLYPQDAGLYIVSLFGQSKNYPPGDEAGFDGFLAVCEIPQCREMVSHAEPVTEIRTSRATANRWRHFERLAEPPIGYVALGDAAACFNPMNGQGISTACLGAKTLDETLTNTDDDLIALVPEFQRRLAERMRFPWTIAIGSDFQYPMTVGDRPEPTQESTTGARYMQSLAELATADVQAAEALFLMTHTFDPGQIYRPEIVRKVEAWVAEGRRPPHLDPTEPPSLPEAA